MVLVGLPDPTPLAAAPLVMQRRRLAGSLIGGVRETQEMLDFCAKHGVASNVEVIPIQQINEAYERMMKCDVRYRFVIDIASLKRPQALPRWDEERYSVSTNWQASLPARWRERAADASRL